MNNAERQIYEFDTFALDGQGRVLLRQGSVVRVTPKALDVLMVLVASPGLVIEKDRLLNEVWGDAFVEEGSLPRTIHELRRVLGDDSSQPKFIETITKRGYRFVAPVECRSFDRQRDALIIERRVHTRLTTTEEEITPPQALRRAEKFRRPAFLAGVAAAALSIAGIYMFVIRPARSTSPPLIRTVAVLPLKSLDQIQDDKSLGLKLADALIQRLGRLDQIVVRPTRSIQPYEQGIVDSLAAGREQQVDVVLDGSFQRAEKRLRLRVQLLRVSDGKQLWASTFDERSTDPFFLEDALAEQAAQALVPHLAKEQREIIARHYTENAEALRLYTEGRYYWNKRTEPGFHKAIDYFNQAIEKDPRYALAYAGLADCYALLSVWGGQPPNDALTRAEQAATTATELDNRLSEAHTSLAFAKWIYDRDWSGAEREFEQAIRLTPGYATAHHWYSYFLAGMGRFDEAIAQIKQARDLDETSASINTDVGEIYCWGRRYDLALTELQEVLKREPNFPPARNILGMAYIKLGRLSEGVAELEAARNLDDGPRVMSALGCAYGLAGRRNEALKILGELQQLSKQRYVSPFAFAMVNTGLGRNDDAMRMLEATYDEHSDTTVILGVYPWMDSLRSDPRFDALLQRIGLK